MWEYLTWNHKSNKTPQIQNKTSLQMLWMKHNSGLLLVGDSVRCLKEVFSLQIAVPTSLPRRRECCFRG